MGFEVYTDARDSALRNGERARAEAEAMRQRTALTAASQAYVGGDTAGARSALGAVGDIDGVMAIDRNVRTTANETAAAAEAALERQRGTVVAGATGLRYLPRDQRWAAYQGRVLPALRSAGLGDDVIAGITEGDMEDATLDSLIAQMGGEVERGSFVNAGNGRVIRPDPYTGAVEEISPAQDPTAPAGYRWTADNGLEAIPGGPADPAQAGRVAASRRAPPRGRSGSRGGGSGSGSRSRSFDAGSIQWD